MIEVMCALISVIIVFASWQVSRYYRTYRLVGLRMWIHKAWVCVENVEGRVRLCVMAIILSFLIGGIVVALVDEKNFVDWCNSQDGHIVGGSNRYVYRPTMCHADDGTVIQKHH